MAVLTVSDDAKQHGSASSLTVSTAKRLCVHRLARVGAAASPRPLIELQRLSAAQVAALQQSHTNAHQVKVDFNACLASINARCAKRDAPPRPHANASSGFTSARTKRKAAPSASTTAGLSSKRQIKAALRFTWWWATRARRSCSRRHRLRSCSSASLAGCRW